MFLTSFASCWRLTYYWFDQGKVFESSVMTYYRFMNSSLLRNVLTFALWPEEIDCIELTGDNVTKLVKACHMNRVSTIRLLVVPDNQFDKSNIEIVLPRLMY